MNYTNMNYIIEDNLDFKTALCDDAELDINVCLISQQVLTKSHINLPCEHKFNYIPLYNELCKQKQKSTFESRTLKVNQLKCPYCRTVYEKILPYIPSERIEKTSGVNYPFKYCMDNNIKCDWVKCGTKCDKTALYIGTTSTNSTNAIGTNAIGTNSYCKKHYLKVQGDIQEKTSIEWTNEMNKLLKSKSLIELKQLLRLNKLKVGGTKRNLVERIFENKLTLI